MSAPEEIGDIFHDEQIEIWAQEILEALDVIEMLDIKSYDDKVQAFRAVRDELRSIGGDVSARVSLGKEV